VTVGREGDKVKPNGKKRMNLRATAHPRAPLRQAAPLAKSLTAPTAEADRAWPTTAANFGKLYLIIIIYGKRDARSHSVQVFWRAGDA
jgi:hypothetical protein